MHIKIDNEVFKIKDSRVAALSAARLPVQQFVHTIRPGDWFIFFNGTVYALTEAQYYAAQKKETVQVLTKEQFEEVFKLSEDAFKESDLKQLKIIKNRKNKCSKCQYNTYKSQVLNIIRKYPDVLVKLGVSINSQQIPPYPQTSGEVLTKVSKVFPRFFGDVSYTRKSCLDCVQKHISMAYVKSCESLQGYPEHFALALANLQEAYEECPKDCQNLRELLLFCIGKSKKDGVAFIPLSNLLYVIDISRIETNVQQALDQNEPDEDFSLELSQEMKENLAALPITVKAKVLNDIEKLLKVEYADQTESTKALFVGYLGSIADIILPFSSSVSNLLRNRRIMFRASPELVCNTEYDNKDIKEAILHPVKVQENEVSDSGTADKA